MRKRSRTQLEALVERATVDCYNDDEQLTGLYTMLADNLITPFSTRVLGMDVTVEDVDLRGNDIVALCSRGAVRQALPVLELPLPTPPPDGAEWIEAYRHGPPELDQSCKVFDVHIGLLERSLVGDDSRCRACPHLGCLNRGE